MFHFLTEHTDVFIIIIIIIVHIFTLDTMARTEDKENNMIAIIAGVLGSAFFLVLLFLIVFAVVVRSFRQKRYRVDTAAERDITIV